MAFKYTVLGWIRTLGLLKQADDFKFFIKKIKLGSKNKNFLAQNPDFPVPPYDLAFDAYNHFDWQEYKEGGMRHARVFTDIINKHANPGIVKVLEWGCGPGRLIRHMSSLIENDTEVYGTDYNPKTIEWCKRNLAGIKFNQNQINPPLPFEENTFDAVYNFSVFTHLSEENQIEWARELRRILKPGGILICSTHGDHYRKLLNAEERVEYDKGRMVTQDKYIEGKKWFLAIHPRYFVENTLLEGFKEVTRIPVSPEANMEQDLWVGQK